MGEAAPSKKYNGAVNPTAVLLLSVIVAVVGALIQIQIGNIADDTRQANSALRQELTVSVGAVKGRVKALEFAGTRLRKVEGSTIQLFERLAATDRQLLGVDSKLQVELLKLDEKLQLEIKFSAGIIERIEKAIERIRRVMAAQARQGKQLSVD